VPKKFVLTNRAVPHEYPALQVRVLGTKINDFGYRYSAWHPVSEKEFSVEWNSGTGGCAAKLRKIDDHFEGMTTCGGDAGPPDQKVRMSVRQSPCPNPDMISKPGNHP
jgi:hypothetical protein